jgi:hypothetical protein
MRCMPIRCKPYEVHAYKVHAYKVHAYEVHAYEVHAYEVHASVRYASYSSVKMFRFNYSTEDTKDKKRREVRWPWDGCELGVTLSTKLRPHCRGTAPQ